MNTDFSKQEHYFLGGIMLLMLAALFTNLGIQPLYLEEPRRALIALEMLFNKNLIVPREFGELYFKKPPLWNWVIILAYKLFGDYSEFAVRFFSVLSFIGIGLTMYFAGRKYVNTRYGILSALFFLVSVDLFFYFSLTGEIDLFYSLIVYLGFLSVFHFYQKQQHYLLFIVSYAFAALGMLTKAFPSVVFQGLTLLSFFIYNKDFKRLFSLAHVVGVGVFIAIIGIYLAAYNHYFDAEYLLEILWSRSSKRTVLQERDPLFFIQSFISFPTLYLVNLMPSTLFVLLFGLNKKFVATLRTNPYIVFCAIILIVNALIYWISPGTRQRYVYMLYPLGVAIFTYFLSLNEDKLKSTGHKILQWIIGAVLTIGLLAGIAINFIPQLHNLPYILPVSIGASVIFAALILIFSRAKQLRILTLIAALIVFRFIFNFTILPARATNSDGQMHKQAATDIVNIVGNKPLYMYGSSCARTTVFYIERERQQTLSYDRSKNPNYYYLTYYKNVNPRKVIVLHEFNNFEYKYWLVRFKPLKH